MKFTRRKRIMLELLAPPPLGVLYFEAASLVMMMTHSPPTGKWPTPSPMEMALWAIVMVLYAYFFAGLPSLVYMLVMEWWFARGLEPGSWLSVGLSTLLGFLAGVTVGYFFRTPDTFGSVFIGIGLAVGFTLGLLIRRGSACVGPAN